MPSVYEIRCPDCGEARTVSEGSVELQLDDGTLIPLRHPCEDLDLKETGFTWGKAYDEARIVGGRTLICQTCGVLVIRRSFVPPFGCRALLIAVIVYILLIVTLAMATAAYVGRNWRPALGLGGMAVVLVYAGWLGHRISGRSYRRNLAERPLLPEVHCCDPQALVPLGKATGRRRFPCPKCGSGNVTVRHFGKS